MYQFAMYPYEGLWDIARKKIIAEENYELAYTDLEKH